MDSNSHRHRVLPQHFSVSLATYVALLTLVSVPPGPARAELEVVPDPAPQAVFGGDERSLRVVLRNLDSTTADLAARARILQTTSSTAAEVSDTPWKRLRVLAGQTVIESAVLSFPAVRGETRFLVQWTDDSRRAIGSTEVRVYPTNLLSALKPLAGDQPLGLLDPQDQLKPMLKMLGVEIEDLANRELDSFSGQLAIVGPFASEAQAGSGLTERIRKLADKGAAVVWILPPEKRNGRLKPTFYSVPIGKGIIVVAQAQLCSRLATDPQAQLNLIRLAQLAVHPEPLNLPSLTSAP